MTSRSDSATPSACWAHTSPNGEPHELRHHLVAVATAAQTSAEPLQSEQWAYLAGLWHDLGKYRPGFQRYIRQVNGHEAHIEGKLPSGSDKSFHF